MGDTRFYHRFPVQLRFSDVDQFGHVNNSVYFQLYDLAKTDYLKNVVKLEDMQKLGVVVANINADFISPIRFSDEIVIETAVIHLGNKSFTLRQRAVKTSTNEIKCDCRTVMVVFDREKRIPVEIPSEHRKAICEFEHSNEQELSVRHNVIS